MSDSSVIFDRRLSYIFRRREARSLLQKLKNRLSGVCGDGVPITGFLSLDRQEGLSHRENLSTVSIPHHPGSRCNVQSGGGTCSELLVWGLLP